LESHDDIPQDFRTQLYAEQQQYQDRKWKRRDSGSSPVGHPPMIINNYIPTNGGQSESTLDVADSSFSQSCSLNIPGLRDEAVKVYSKWQCSKVGCPIQRQHYELARDLTLERGSDLELVYEDKDAQFYAELGVLEGVARRWVRDVKTFLDEYDTL